MEKDSILLTVQIGLPPKTSLFDIGTRSSETVGRLKALIANHKQTTADRVTLIWNGKKLDHNDRPIANLGMMSKSKIIAILSSKPASPPEPEQPEKPKIVLTCKFNKRPFGFAVWANADGKNAIVTKVAGKQALQLGIQIGYVVDSCNGEEVYGKPHDEVLDLLKTTECPLTLKFADLGEQYECQFKKKPLGFTVIQDREENNAKVSKINTREAQDHGVKIGSYIVKVNDTSCFGWKHLEIIQLINKSSFPMTITYRHPPPLLMLSPRKRARK